MPRLANQPSFISRTKRTGLAEQWLSSVCGFMSSMLTTLPSSPMKATESGISVFLIQKHCCAGLLEDEQHAVVGRHRGAEHQADLALLRRRRQLGVDVVDARR